MFCFNLITPDENDVKICCCISSLLIRQNLFLSGTPEYCPPEYYVDHKYHGKPTTVWSLGVLLFMLVCGHYPEPRDMELIDYGVWFEPDLSNSKI